MFSARSILKYYLILIRPYKIPIFLMFLMVAFRILFSIILIPFLYKSIIDVLSMSQISIAERSYIAFLFLIPMAVGFVSSATVNRYRDFLNFKTISNVTKDIYDFSFLKLANHSYKFYSDRFSGSLVAKIKRFVRAFEAMNKIIIGSFWFILILISSSIFVLYSESKIIAGYLIAWSALYIFITLFFVKKKMRLDLLEAEADSKITGVLADSITNVLNIKIFSAFDKEFNYFKKFSKLLRDRIYNTSKFDMLRSITQAVLMVGFQIFILYTMIQLWGMGVITIGVFVLTYVYVFSIFERVWDLSEDMALFMKSTADMKEMVDIFETEVEVKDIENPEICRIKNGKIEFKNVSFGYIEENVIFKDFNLTIEPGEKIGLVGHSGSGKSTITKLVLRFINTSKGEILIDGQNIVNIKQDDLRNVISYVPQDSILFHRSVKENIGYSKNYASDAEIIEASKKAHADDFIKKLPKGYDTLVGERGVKLSGGERQRVAIARAMLKDSPILMLDEATSSLDSISETYIQDAFNELMKGKTTIVIAHRLSTIQKMDRIIVLDQGKIVEEGTHKELLAKNGFYAELWNHQTGGFLD
ncbi:MAG: ABC transporter ATP-binding protein [Candidatus Paceibacterota bacterium]